MENKLHTAVCITKEAKNTTIEDCDFINCGIDNSGDGTSMIRNRFARTKEWIAKRPAWLKMVIFFTGTTVTAVIARAIEKFWL